MNFWQDVPFSERVQLYGVHHILFILSVIVIVSLFVWKLGTVKERFETVRKLFIGVSTVQVIVLYSWSVFELGFSLEAGLPIHLCRISTLLGLWFLITKNTKIFHALFYTSVFALVAIFYPVNVHPIYTHIIGYSYQISHIMILLVWILGVFVYGYRPNLKTMSKVFLIFIGVVLLVWQFNYFVGNGEYLYLRGDVNRPFFKEMHDLLWIFLVLVVSYIVMLLMTLPFMKRGDKDASIGE